MSPCIKRKISTCKGVKEGEGEILTNRQTQRQIRIARIGTIRVKDKIITVYIPGVSGKPNIRLHKTPSQSMLTDVVIPLKYGCLITNRQ